jgi:hypothetical protein
MSHTTDKPAAFLIAELSFFTGRNGGVLVDLKYLQSVSPRKIKIQNIQK